VGGWGRLLDGESPGLGQGPPSAEAPIRAVPAQGGHDLGLGVVEAVGHHVHGAGIAAPGDPHVEPRRAGGLATA